jgi:LacI family transcriptional regulator
MPRIAVAIRLNWPVRHHYDVIQGVQRFADEAGDWTLEVGAFPHVYVDMGHKYDGIVGRITPAIWQAAKKAGIPVVNTWMSSPIANEVANVHVDFRAAGEIAAEHLYARGLRRLVHIGVRRQVATQQHYEGVAAAIADHRCSLDRLLLPSDFDSTQAKWKRFIERIRKASKDWQMPIGVTTVVDDIARPVIFELERLGVEIPHDVAVVGCHNEETYCTHLFPNLSSIDLGYNRNGYEAASLLSRLINGEPTPTEVKYLAPMELVVRDSSDFFAVNDKRVAAAMRYMAENSERQISVAMVAEAAGITQQNLNKLFHRYVGHTVNAELIRLRVEHFKRLLVESDRPVKELYKLSGFGTESLAYPTFKRLTGQTPSEYRDERRSRE